MKKPLWTTLLGVVVLACGCAATPDMPKASTTEIGPPLLDRELFFGDPEISSAALSPDGKYVAFIKPYRDVRNIWVKGIDAPFDAAQPVTADQRPVVGYFWSQDARYILYVQDKDGNENFHVYAVDPKAEPVRDTGVPSAADLTPIEGVRAYIYSVPKKKPGEIIVGLNDRDSAYHDVYRVEIATGKRELLIKNTQKVGYFVYDLEGNVRIAMRQTDDAGWEFLRVEGDELVKFHECPYGTQCAPYRFHKDGKRCYFISNKGQDVDLTRLMLIDPQTGQTELVESDPDQEVDFSAAVFSEKTDELIATIYVGDRVRIYPKTEETKRDLEFLKENLPPGELGLQSMSRDMRWLLVSVSRDVDPGSVYLYDREKQKVAQLYRSRPDLPSEHLAHMKAVRFKARDGLTIPAYLTIPRGAEPKNLPTVLFPHGGPWARDTWGYDAYAQFLANRGYAVLQPNFRGSSGYGKKFLNAGDREWGTGAMQHDITDSVKWLIAQGIADPEKVCIFGGSYGGYATLAGVTFTPDLYTCGAPYVAPSNLITLLESIPAYWKPFAKQFFKRVGDPEVEADRKDLTARSPLNFADRIRVPLLVIHGANDPRVKQAEADRIVVALRDKGQPVEYIVASDEGHGFRAPDNRMALAAALERFLARHLGGRYQQKVREKIAGQLEKITVDPKAVKLPDEAARDLLAKAETAPLPAASGSAIEPGSMQYKVTLTMGQKKMDLDLSRVIERVKSKGETRWRITSTVKLPQGKQVDVFDLDGNSLLPIERTLSGMANMKLSYGKGAITGEMGARGRSVPVNKKLKAPVLGDGIGLELAIAGMSLGDGYTTTLRSFEPSTQKVRPIKLEVTGQEKTKSAAGEFDTWILKLITLDGDAGGSATMRVLRSAPHHVIKSEYKLPAVAGGGTMTAELTATGK